MILIGMLLIIQSIQKYILDMRVEVSLISTVQYYVQYLYNTVEIGGEDTLVNRIVLLNKIVHLGPPL